MAMTEHAMRRSDSSRALDWGSEDDVPWGRSRSDTGPRPFSFQARVQLNNTPLELLSEHFTGREEEMRQILASFEEVHEDMPNRCLLYGDRGVGKTQLALRLSFTQRQYQHIFWIEAATAEELRQGFSKLLHSINHPGRSNPDEGIQLAVTRRWLEDFTFGKWLLIFDNVTHGSLAFLHEHLPRKNSSGDILITTRMEGIASALMCVSGKQHFAFKLRTLDIDGAAHLLLRHCPSDIINADTSQIRDIVDCLDCLPLAVARIATCLKQAKVTLAELLAIFKKNQTRINMINWENFPSIYEDAATKEPFTSQLEGFLQQDSISCIDMLVNFSADFSPWKFPREWLEAEAGDIRLVIQAVASRHKNPQFVEEALQGLKIYERLIVFIFTLLTFYVVDERRLDEFAKSLEQWRSWDELTIIQHHKLIHKYLTDLFRDYIPKHSTLYPDHAFRKILAIDTISLCAKLTPLVMDKTHYKRILGQRGEAAQAFLDLLQARLDVVIDPAFKQRHIKALIRLSRRAKLYPECIVLESLEWDRDPVAIGSFGDVHKARLQGHDVAVKILRLFRTQDMDQMLKDFASEAVTWRQLSHPNVLPFYGLYRLNTNPQRLCLAGPWMEYGNLVHFLADQTDSASTMNCVLLALDIAQGLHYLHSQQVIHGDIKGLNILVSKSRRAYLADFGLATLVNSSPNIMTYVSTKRNSGTVAYQAPELMVDMDNPVVSKPDSVSTASDIYAFALVCYEMFSGKFPFHDIRNEFQLMLVVKRGGRPVRPTHSLCHLRGLTDVMWNLMKDCWADRPQDRPSAAEVVSRIRTLCGPPVDDRPCDTFPLLLSTQLLRCKSEHPLAALWDTAVAFNDGMPPTTTSSTPSSPAISSSSSSDDDHDSGARRRNHERVPDQRNPKRRKKTQKVPGIIVWKAKPVGSTFRSVFP